MKEYYATKEANRALSKVHYGLTSFLALINAVADDYQDDDFREQLMVDYTTGLEGFLDVVEHVAVLVGELNLAVICLDEYNHEFHNGDYQMEFRAYQTTQNILSDEEGWFVENHDNEGQDTNNQNGGDNELPF